MYFIGSDVILLNEFPVLMDPSYRPWVEKFRRDVMAGVQHATEIWVASEHLIPELRSAGITRDIKVVPNEIRHKELYPKIRHDEFNILYYCNDNGKHTAYRKWIYGYNVYQDIKEYFKKYPDINFLLLTGQSSADMKDIYPITDFYLRPNNHDGNPRMARECQIQEIPYYWSYVNPDINEAIKMIEEEYRKKKSSLNESISASQ